MKQTGSFIQILLHYLIFTTQLDLFNAAIVVVKWMNRVNYAILTEELIKIWSSAGVTSTSAVSPIGRRWESAKLRERSAKLRGLKSERYYYPKRKIILLKVIFMYINICIWSICTSHVVCISNYEIELSWCMVAALMRGHKLVLQLYLMVEG